MTDQRKHKPGHRPMARKQKMKALRLIQKIWVPALVGFFMFPSPSFAEPCAFTGECHVYAKRAFFSAVHGDDHYNVCRCINVAKDVHRPSPGSGNWPILLAVTAVLNDIDTIGGQPFSDADLYNFLRGVGGWQQHNGKEGGSYVYEAWNVAAVLALLDWAHRNSRTQTITLCNTWLRTQWAKHTLAAASYPDKFLTVSGVHSFGPRNPNRRPVDRGLWSALPGNRMLTRGQPNAAHSGSPDATMLGSLLAWAIALPNRTYQRPLPQYNPSHNWMPDPTEDWAWVLSVVSILNNGAGYGEDVPADRWGLTEHEQLKMRQFVQAEEAQTQAAANQIAAYLQPFRPRDGKGILFRRYGGGRLLTVLQGSSNAAKPAANIVYLYPNANDRVAQIISPSDWAGVQVPASTARVDENQNKVTTTGGRKNHPGEVNTYQISLPSGDPQWEVRWNFNGFGAADAPFAALDLVREIQPNQKLVLKVDRDLAANPGGLNLNLDPHNPIVSGPDNCGNCALDVIGNNKKRLRFRPNQFQGATQFTFRITDGSATADGTVTVITGDDGGDPTTFEARDDQVAMSPFSSEIIINVLENDQYTGAVDFTENGLIYDPQEIQGRLELIDTADCNMCIRYRPNAGFLGSINFDYELVHFLVVDNMVLLDQATVTIDRINHPPDARDDVFDLNGHPNTKRLNLTENDMPVDEGDRVILLEEDFLVPPYPLGTVTRVSNRKVDYTPPNPLPSGGIDQFQYVARDRLGLVDTATVTIHFGDPVVVTGCDPGIVAGDDFSTTDHMRPITIDVLANDSHLNGSPLSLGTVSHTGAGTLEVLDQQVLVYTPRVGAAELGANACVIEYQVFSEDGDVASAIAEVEVTLDDDQGDPITIVRHPPAITGAPNGVDVVLPVEVRSLDDAPVIFQWERRLIGSSDGWESLVEAGHFAGTDSDLLEIRQVSAQERAYQYRARAALSGTEDWLATEAGELVVIPFKSGDTYDGTANPQTPVVGDVVQAEYYNEGQFGYAFYDHTVFNSGNDGFRANAVDVSTEGTGAQARTFVTHTQAGEWLTYNLHVDQPGLYSMAFTYRTPEDAGLGGTMLVTSENDTVDLGMGLLNSTGIWTTDTLNSVVEFQTAGDKTLVLGFNDPYLEIDHFRLQSTLTGQGPSHGTPATEGLWVEAEYFDTGPHNVAYHDKTLFNSGNIQIRQGYADTSTENDRVYLTHMDNGEWAEYSFEFGETGAFDLHLRYRAAANASLRLQDELGLDLPITLPATGDSWQVLTLPGFLPINTAGEKVLRWFVQAGSPELDAFAFGDVDSIIDFQRLAYSTGISGDPCEHPSEIPGVIHLECYDLAVDSGTGQPLHGQNRVYFDTTPDPNTGSSWYRPEEGPDLLFENPAGAFSGIVLTHVQPTEWLTYSVDVNPQPDNPLHQYTVFVRYTSKYTIDPPSMDGRFSLEHLVDDHWHILATVTLPAVPPNTWENVIAIPDIVFPPGEQVLRITAHDPTFKLDRLEIFPNVPVPEPENDIVIVQTNGQHGDQSHFTIPQSELLANDEPAGLEIADVSDYRNGYVWIGDAQDQIEFSTTGAFWWQRQGSFTYHVNHPFDPYTRVEAKVVVVPEGPEARRDYFQADNNQSPSADLTIPVADILDNDLPSGGFCQSDITCLRLVSVDASVQGQAVYHQASNSIHWSYDGDAVGGSFEYTIEIPGTQVQSVGKVYITVDNPIRAQDDVVVRSGLQDMFPLALQRETLLGNDLLNFGINGPADNSLDLLYFDPDFMPEPHRFDPPNSAHFLGVADGNINPEIRIELHIDDFSQKYIKFPYRTQICDGEPTDPCPEEPIFTDEAMVTLVRGPHAQSDVVLVPFQPENGEIVIPAEAVLANDRVNLRPDDRIYVVGAGGGQNGAIGNTGHGDVLRQLDKIVYKPSASFWQDRRDEFTYQVWLDERPESIDEAQVVLIATNGVLANDDSFALSPSNNHTTNPLAIHYNALLANDRPHLAGNAEQLLEVLPGAGSMTQTAAGGTAHFIVDWVDYFPPASGAVFDWFTYRVRLTEAPDQEATGTVFIVPQADWPTMPHPLAQPDQAETVADTAIWIDVLANDGQPNLVLELPAAGSIVDQSNPGTVSIQNQGFLYTPAPGKTGSDQFSYRARDQYGRWTAHTPVTVTIHPEPLIAREDLYLIQPGMNPVSLWLQDLTVNDLPHPWVSVVGFGTPLFGSLQTLEDRLLFHPSEQFWSAGGDRFSYQIATADGLLPPAQGVVTLRALTQEPLFSDDMESGHLQAWDYLIANHPSGAVVATPAEPLSGTWSMAIEIPQNAQQNSFYGDKVFESDQTHLNMGFRMDTTGLALEDSPAGLAIMTLRGDQATLTLSLRQMAGEKQMQIRTRDDLGVQHTSPWVGVPGTPFQCQLEWWASSSPETTDGGARLWLDTRPVAGLTGLNNHRTHARRIRLGVLYGMQPGDEGRLLYDDLFVWQGHRTRTQVFGDGFESGDLSAWSGSTTQGGTLLVQPQAALEGQFGLLATAEAQVEDNRQFYVEDDSPDQEDHLWVGWDFHPYQPIPDQNGETVHYPIFTSGSATGAAFKLELYFQDTGYSLVLQAQRDNGTWANSQAIPIPLAWHRLHIQWQAAEPGTENGFARLFLNGLQVAQVQNLANAAKRVDQANLGVVYGFSAKSVTHYFDNYKCWRGDRSRLILLEDGFEIGLAAWSPYLQGGATATTSTAAALEGNQGLRVTLPPPSSPEPRAQLRDFSVGGAESLGISFQFDATGLHFPNQKHPVTDDPRRRGESRSAGPHPE